MHYDKFLIFSIFHHRHIGQLTKIFFPRSRYLIFSTGFKKKTVKVADKFQFSYLERGSPKECEKSLLLVHGFSSDKESWCFMGSHIPKRIHIVALDIPGHGETTKKEKDDISIRGLAKRVKQVNLPVSHLYESQNYKL